MEERKTNRKLVAVGWSVLFALKECRPPRIAFFTPCEDSAETKHATLAVDSTKTRRNPSTQPKPETRQRLDERLAYKPSIRLGRDSAENLGARIPLDWISISSRTSSSSAAGWKPENQTGCLSPSDGASCWASFLFVGITVSRSFVPSSIHPLR
jgi:hypothetical protein